MQPSVQPNPKKRPHHEISNEQRFQFQVDQFEYQQRLTREQHRRVDEIAQQLAFLDQHESITINKRRKNARKLPDYPIIKHRRNLTIDEQRRVIWLRFGSLDSMETLWHTSKEVYEKTGVKPNAQCNLIRRWQKRGNKVISLVSRRGPLKMLNYDTRAYFANPQTLMEMRHLSLTQRAEVLKQRFGLAKLSAMTVWRYYREFDAKYVKPKIVYRSKNER